MKITFDKNSFLRNFLLPVSRVSEQCSIKMTSDKMYTLVSNETQSISLYCELNTKTCIDVGTDFSLNIKDVRKLNQVFSCINSALIDVDIDKNASVLKYQSPALSFKLHLVSDVVIRKCPLSLTKLNAIKYDCEFDISGVNIAEILKGGAFATETEKVYFYIQDGRVYGELTNHAVQDIDSITYEIAQSFSGTPITKPIPFNLEVLRLVLTTKPATVRVKVNSTYNLLTFETTTTECVTRYTIAAFTK